MANKNNSGSSQTKSPKGSTKSLTSEQHAAIRRAKKASQNANARAAAAHKQESGGTYIDGLHQDKVQEREEAKRRRQENLVLLRFEQRKRRLQQAMIAADIVMSRLEKGTSADKMARAIIGEYPTAEPVCDSYGNVTNNSVNEAIEMARRQMDKQDLSRKRAINYGISVAKEALTKAHLELKRQGK